MSETSSRLWRALRDLLIAMINATLILVAVCLFLGLRLVDRVDSMASNFARSLVSIEPLREDVQAMTSEITGLRADLAEVRGRADGLTDEAATRLTARIDAFDARMDDVGTRMQTVRDRIEAAELAPAGMLGEAAEAAAREFATTLGFLSGCSLPAGGSPGISDSSPEMTAPPAGSADGG